MKTFQELLDAGWGERSLDPKTGGCPGCGAVGLVIVEDAEQELKLFCRECNRCWGVEGDRLHHVVETERLGSQSVGQVGGHHEVVAEPEFGQFLGVLHHPDVRVHTTPELSTGGVPENLEVRHRSRGNEFGMAANADARLATR